MDHTPDDIIRSVDKGIYCISFANGQVNIGGEIFRLYVKHGYLIENGRLTQPIKDVNIIGNGPEALSQIDMVGNDMTLDEGGWTCGKEGQGFQSAKECLPSEWQNPPLEVSDESDRYR